MSSVVVSGDSSDGAASQGSGGEDNPIELDDSSTTSSKSTSESETQMTPGPLCKQEDNRSDNGDDSGDESDKDGEDDKKEIPERYGDDAMSIDVGAVVNESAEGNESELENNKSGEEESEHEDNDNDSASKGSGDASTKTANTGRVKKKKEIWGNIESMSKFSKSPYEGNECAEVGEDCFEEFRTLMDCSETDGKVNPRMETLVGDKLARDICNAHREIGKSGMLYSANWKEGKIRDSDFGWIPKRQLLLCLHEHRFAKGNVIVLQAVTKNLDCSKLVLEAMKLWDLMDAYPNLASNKNEETFVFGSLKVSSFKCQIFVARAFATLQILNKTEGIQQSLTKKIKACLDIMNKHVRANPVELARIRKKAKKRKASQATRKEEPNIVDRKSQSSRSKKYKKSGNSRSKVESSKDPISKDKSSASGATKIMHKRRRKIPKHEEREESIVMLFNTMHTQVQRLNQMMSFFQSQLQDHRGILREEIREKLENDGIVKRGKDSR